MNVPLLSFAVETAQIEVHEISELANQRADTTKPVASNGEPSYVSVFEQLHG